MLKNKVLIGVRWVVYKFKFKKLEDDEEKMNHEETEGIRQLRAVCFVLLTEWSDRDVDWY